MSTSGGDPISNDRSSSIFAAQPFAWILVPLAVFISIGLLATVIQIRRRRRLRRLGLSPADIERQLRNPRARREPDPSARGRRTGPGRTTAARWGWTTRSEEGLNELGEAPPAYEHKPKTREGVSVELEPMGRTQTQDASPVGLPPGYDASPGSTSTTSSPPPLSTPAPAVLPNNSHRHA